MMVNRLSTTNKQIFRFKKIINKAMNTQQSTLESKNSLNSPVKATFKELPMQFLGKGQNIDYTYLQEASSQDGYMFLVLYKAERWYEVFKRSLNYDKFINEYPQSDAFGQTAWRVGTKEEAYDLFFKISGID